MKAKALLFDTRSIQRYIYSGNRLKTNIGASYLVDRVFEDVLVGKILEGTEQEKGLFYGNVDTASRFSPSPVDWSGMEKQCAVAYTGGGNALILFRPDTEDGVEKKVVQAFSQALLTSHPGLHIGAAFGPLDLSSQESFQEGIDDLYKKLKQTQATVFPQVNVPYTGLTLACEVNGETANFCDTKGLIDKKGDDGPRFFSQETAMKTKASEKANQRLRNIFAGLFAGRPSEKLFESYEFPLSLDELGQRQNETRENYIAIVHIDGNNMGQKFRQCKDMEERRILAMDIQRKTETSFAILLEEILAACEGKNYENELDLSPKKNGSIPADKKILPIRPLILGGDDVTFICPAKMAVPFTKRMMEILLADIPADYPQVSSQVARKIDSCAGIAILPTSYPFFRGYVLSEQLCDAAKKRMRATTQDGSALGTAWLDFAILHGEQAPTLEQIREREYRGERGPMHFGPYQVGNQAGKDEKARRHNIENLLACVHAFQRGTKPNASGSAMPMNKIKELRSVLQQSRYQAEQFLVQLDRLGQKMPTIADWAAFLDEKAALWLGTKRPETPYVDAIEMMDFIPEEAAK